MDKVNTRLQKKNQSYRKQWNPSGKYWKQGRKNGRDQAHSTEINVAASNAVSKWLKKED